MTNRINSSDCLLDTSILVDAPLPVFKSFSQILGENLLIGIFLLILLLSATAFYWLKRKKKRAFERKKKLSRLTHMKRPKKNSRHWHKRKTGRSQNPTSSHFPEFYDSTSRGSSNCRLWNKPVKSSSTPYPIIPFWLFIACTVLRNLPRPGILSSMHPKAAWQRKSPIYSSLLKELLTTPIRNWKRKRKRNPSK